MTSERIINNLTMASAATDLQQIQETPINSNSPLDLTTELLEAMNRTIDVLVRAGARSKSMDQKRLAWEIIRYLRQEVKESRPVSSTNDLHRAIAALMPSVNVQVNVDGERERDRHRLQVKAETGLTAAIRERAANQLAKLDAQAGRQSSPAVIDAKPVEPDQTDREPIQAAEK